MPNKQNLGETVVKDPGPRTIITFCRYPEVLIPNLNNDDNVNDFRFNIHCGCTPHNICLKMASLLRSHFFYPWYLWFAVFKEMSISLLTLERFACFFSSIRSTLTFCLRCLAPGTPLSSSTRTYANACGDDWAWHRNERAGFRWQTSETHREITLNKKKRHERPSTNPLKRSTTWLYIQPSTGGFHLQPKKHLK